MFGAKLRLAAACYAKMRPLETASLGAFVSLDHLLQGVPPATRDSNTVECFNCGHDLHRHNTRKTQVAAADVYQCDTATGKASGQ